MNLKISDKAITYKITEDELYNLSYGQKIENVLTLAETILYYSVEKDDRQVDGMSLIVDTQNMILKVPAHHIQTLLDLGKDRDGVQSCVNGIKLSLQVDIRKDSRKRAKG